MRNIWFSIVAAGLMLSPMRGQANEAWKRVLANRPSSEQEISAQLDKYVRARIPALKPAGSAEEWQEQAAALRTRVLEEVVYRGVPEDWRTATSRFEDAGEIKTPHGYRIRKLRLQALPGLWIPALLYEPDNLTERVPVVLNVNGHERIGKSVDYKQLRCIHQAKRGLLALNLEWIGMGQLRVPGLEHNNLAKLDLCGRSGLAVFHRAMSCGLDFLLQHPNADAERVAVTGLSGGGWQTILLSSLDTRVRLAVPVAGHSSLRQRLNHRGSLGDLEQLPNDLIGVADYVHLNALMVPRPTLCIYNATDNCCFVAETVKPNTFDPVSEFYEQAGVADSWRYYVNYDPGDHNYQKDNRQQLYAFLEEFFLQRSGRVQTEPDFRDELQTHESLLIQLPQSNATFDSLALEAARDLPQRSGEDSAKQRLRLKKILRLPAAKGAEVQQKPLSELEQISVRQLVISHAADWEMSAVMFEPDTTKDTVIYLDDNGIESQATDIQKLVASGSRVLAVDPLLIGNSRPAGSISQSAMLLATVGSRPLGIQAQHLTNLVTWAQSKFGPAITVRTGGPRTSLIAICSAATSPRPGLSLDLNEAPTRFDLFLAPERRYEHAPEAYCFGLYQSFDLVDLRRLASSPP